MHQRGFSCQTCAEAGVQKGLGSQTAQPQLELWPLDVLIQALDCRKPSSHTLGSRLVGEEETSCLAQKLESVVKIPAPLTAVSTQSFSLARGVGLGLVSLIS